MGLHFLFCFNDTATTEIYTLSLHDALPIYHGGHDGLRRPGRLHPGGTAQWPVADRHPRGRSEEHTSELQSRLHLVCRLLLEKKKTTIQHYYSVQYTTTHKTHYT